MAALLIGLCSCGVSGGGPSSYVSPYNWNNLIKKDGRYYYYKDNTLQSRFGIDVSEHQGVIDWEAAADDGVEFAIIRLGNRGSTEGDLYVDDYFEYNLREAKEAGIQVGIYFFSQAINEDEAQEEAEFVLAMLGGKNLDYPVVFDHEPIAGIAGRANSMKGSEITKCAEVFCSIVYQAGYKTEIYGNQSDISKLGKDVPNNYNIWFAEYEASHPTGQFDFNIWQYSSAGTVAGVPTRVDLNIHFLQA